MDKRLRVAIQWQKLFLGCLLVSLSTCLGTFSLRAQEGGTGSVSGIVRNDQGDPLSGVTVVATNVTTGLSAGAQTDTSGIFRFPKLPSKDQLEIN